MNKRKRIWIRIAAIHISAKANKNSFCKKMESGFIPKELRSIKMA